MRIVYVGCVDFSYRLLRAVSDVPEAEVVGVVTRESSPENADHRSLAPLANELHVPCVDGFDADWIRAQKPDVVYCFGWPRLIPEPDSLSPMGVIGYHPTLLPEGRGRHPIIWALVQGLESTGSTFFKMDERADAGPILSQKTVDILWADTARKLYERLAKTAYGQVAALTRSLIVGISPHEPQDDAKSSYWRKRTSLDGRIKWSGSAVDAFNLVRALSDPYPGATALRADGTEFSVLSAEIAYAVWIDDAVRKFGRVFAVDSVGALIQCGRGALRIGWYNFERAIEVGEVLL